MSSRFVSYRIEPPGITLDAEVEALSTWIERDTQHSSRTKDAVNHPGFEELVGHGRDTLPKLLSLLKTLRPGWWIFEAISRIIGNGPHIPTEAAGRYMEIVHIYIGWIEEHLHAVVQDGHTLPVNAAIIDYHDFGSMAFDPITIMGPRSLEMLGMELGFEEQFNPLLLCGFFIERSEWLG